jgi:hypothetical protein
MLGRVNRVLVTNVEANNTGTSLPTIINGDMLILNRAFSNLTGTPTITSAVDNDLIYIAQGIAASKAILSLPIALKHVTSVKRASYVAPAEQVSHIGYNGTSGTITPENSTEYSLIIQLKDDQRVMVNRPSRQVFSYTSDSTATAEEIATSFARKINVDRYISTYVKAEAVSDGTATASGQTATVTNGSKTVSYGGAVTIASGAYVYLAGATYKVATGVTAGTSITLDAAYQGTTGTIASGTTYASNNGVLTAIANAGIKLTGKSIAYNGIDKYQKVIFETSLFTDSNTATVTATTAMAFGTGFWQQVRDMEYDAQGYLGVTNRTLFPSGNLGSGTPATRAVDGTLYNLLVIEHFDEHPGDLQGQYKSPMTTVIAFASASAPTKSTKETTIIDILESLFESAGVFVE